jgi:hypothetical protein
MSKLLINEYPLQVLPSLAVAIGLNEAIVLQQVHYWLDRSNVQKKGHVWVYNTVPQWQAQFPFWSADTVRRALANLKQRGLLVGECLADNSFDKTMYYRIDYAQLAAVEDGNLQSSDDGKLQSSTTAKSNLLLDRTETTTETTQKGASRRRAARSALSLAAWLETCKANNERAIPEDDSIFEYARKQGLPEDFIRFAWLEFKRKFADESKKQKDWRAHFRNAVRENWYGLWFISGDGNCLLTTRGKQVEREHAEGA